MRYRLCIAHFQTIPHLYTPCPISTPCVQSVTNLHLISTSHIQKLTAKLQLVPHPCIHVQSLHHLLPISSYFIFSFVHAQSIHHISQQCPVGTSPLLPMFNQYTISCTYVIRIPSLMFISKHSTVREVGVTPLGSYSHLQGLATILDNARQLRDYKVRLYYESRGTGHTCTLITINNQRLNVSCGGFHI